MLNENASDYKKLLSYYYIGQCSKVIKPHSKRIGFSKYNHNINMTAFKNIDGSIAVCMFNTENHDINFNICINNVTFKDTLEHQSFISYLIVN